MEESDHEDLEPVQRNVAAATVEASPPATRHSNTEISYDIVDADYGDQNQRGGATIVSARTGMNRVLLAADGSNTRNATYSYANRPAGGGGPATRGRIIRVRADTDEHGFVADDADMTNPAVRTEPAFMHDRQHNQATTFYRTLPEGRRQYPTARVMAPTSGNYARISSPNNFVSYDAVTGQQVIRRTHIVGGYAQQRTATLQAVARRLPPTQRWATHVNTRMPFMRMRRQPGMLRPMYFDHESNEAEDRAIAEAIAREEELMRMEEERELELSRTFDADFQRIEEEILRKEAAARQQLEAQRLSGFQGYRPLIHAPASRLEHLTNLKVQQMMDAPSNLAPTPYDTDEDRAVKMTLDGMITQVSKWDRQYGWHKNILRKLREKRGLSTEPTMHSFGHSNNNYHSSFVPRTQPVRQVDAILHDPMERLRREINKRRLRLEFEAEDALGISSPWRKGKSRPPRPPPKPTAPAQLQTPVDPATISLFDDVSAADHKTVVETTHGGEHSNSASGLVSPSHRSHGQKKRSSISDKHERKRKRSHHGSERDDPAHRSQKKSESVASTSALSIKSEGAYPLEIDVNGRHCYCNRPYNPKKFYVACDRCYKWFHGKCIGITEKKAQKMDSWVCRECDTQPPEELYCICRRPYDQSRFYVGCDTCEGWFHPECVGTTQRDIEQCKQYYCPDCRPLKQPGHQRPSSSQAAGGYESSSSATSLSAVEKADYDILWRLFNSLMDHRNSAPFRMPVSPQKYSTYNDVIKLPMDLSIMRHKLEGREYLHLKDFVSDVCLIFENARLVNSRTTHIWHCAEVLEKKFREDLIAVKEEVDKRRISECPTTASLDIDSDTLLGFGSDINLDPAMLQDFL